MHTTFDQLVVNSPLHPPTFRTIPEQATSENDKTVNAGSRLHHPAGRCYRTAVPVIVRAAPALRPQAPGLPGTRGGTAFHEVMDEGAL